MLILSCFYILEMAFHFRGRHIYCYKTRGRVSHSTTSNCSFRAIRKWRLFNEHAVVYSYTTFQNATKTSFRDEGQRKFTLSKTSWRAAGINRKIIFKCTYFGLVTIKYAPHDWAASFSHHVTSKWYWNKHTMTRLAWFTPSYIRLGWESFQTTTE